MKKCRKCGKEKQLDEFGTGSGKYREFGVNDWCKSCYREYGRNKYNEAKDKDDLFFNKTLMTRQQLLWTIKLKSGCSRCGFNKHPAALDFHHRNPDDKKFCISSYVGDEGLLIEEIKKCDVLCKNCHAMEHSIYNLEDIVSDKFGSYKPRILPKNRLLCKCGNIKLVSKIQCNECLKKSIIDKKKIVLDDLLKLIEKQGICETARNYGVCYRTLNNWLFAFGIDAKRLTRKLRDET